MAAPRDWTRPRLQPRPDCLSQAILYEAKNEDQSRSNMQRAARTRSSKPSPAGRINQALLEPRSDRHRSSQPPSYLLALPIRCCNDPPPERTLPPPIRQSTQRYPGPRNH
ncbi:hypothetical protein VDGE_30589 [Verticillium dahliae]|uniref:Uncharacterized protein n=1 Tax=Verticillium dahliae TaxID=27337 RepID=A0A444RZD3_VERDA|nr:hypothetical protein VDGE_30589 [Verticillium dahliae]